MNIEKNLFNVKAEGMEAISRLEKEIQALKKAVEILDTKAEASETNSAAEADSVTETEVPRVRESIFDKQSIKDLWFDWQEKYDKANFAGFVNYDMPGDLVVGKRYGLSIGPVALIGERIQMLVMLFTEEEWEFNKSDTPVGFLIEEYKIGTKAFNEMATAVFAPFHESVISVEVDRIRDAFGTIGLKVVNGKIGLDWKSFDPEQTPQSEAFMATWKIADVIKSAD